MTPRPLRFLLVCLLGLVLGACTKKQHLAEVMSKEFRPRPPEQSTKEGRTTHHHEHWVHVRFVGSSRKVDVPVDKTQWDNLKVGDRVQATYREGNYTGTIWAIDVEK
jgi:hypothetical protein